MSIDSTDLDLMVEMHHGKALAPLVGRPREKAWWKQPLPADRFLPVEYVYYTAAMAEQNHMAMDIVYEDAELPVGLTANEARVCSLGHASHAILVTPAAGPNHITLRSGTQVLIPLDKVFSIRLRVPDLAEMVCHCTTESDRLCAFCAAAVSP